MTPLAWTVRLLSLAALGLSAFLWWTSATTETAIGCDFTAFDCDAALASRWAKWLGVPVAAGGALCYAAALIGAILAPRHDSGWRLLEFAVPLAAGAGVWFFALQATQLESFCLWCVATHVCGAALAVATLGWRWAADSGDTTPIAVGLSTADTPVDLGPPGLGAPTVAGLLGVIALVVGQLVAAPPEVVASEPEITETFDLVDPPTPDPPSPPQPEPAPSTPAKAAVVRRDPNASRVARFLKGRLELDVYDHAVLGSPEAPNLVIELMDYACPHCREFHEKVTAALERFDGEVAVIVMPVPGEKVCNPYVAKARKRSVGACYAAKLSVAVARLAPEDFPRFHHWMLEAENIPSRTASLIQARQRVDPEELSELLRDTNGTLANRVKQYVELSATLGRRGRFGLPSQILGDQLISGPAKTTDALCEQWSDAFGIELPTDEVPF